MKFYLTLFLPLAFLTACASTGTVSNVIIPKESITSQAPALAQDILSNISLYVKQKYKCEKWHIVNIKHISADDQTTFTKESQIYAGKIAETWNIKQCGSDLQLGLLMTPDGNKGSYIGITSLK